MAFFVFPDFIRLLQGQPDIVQSVHQAILAERIDSKSEHQAGIFVFNHHFFQIDRQLITRLRFYSRKQLVDLLFRQGNRQKTVFETVVEKNVGKISAAMGESLKQAGIKAGDIELVILTGGSTEIPAVQKSLCAFFPGAEVSQDDKLSSVGLGLAYDSMRRFG